MKEKKKWVKPRYQVMDFERLNYFINVKAWSEYCDKGFRRGV